MRSYRTAHRFYGKRRIASHRNDSRAAFVVRERGHARPRLEIELPADVCATFSGQLFLIDDQQQSMLVGEVIFPATANTQATGDRR
jgi:hypothetical protein